MLQLCWPARNNINSPGNANLNWKNLQFAEYKSNLAQIQGGNMRVES